MQIILGFISLDGLPHSLTVIQRGSHDVATDSELGPVIPNPGARMQDVVFPTIEALNLNGVKRAILLECAIQFYFGEAQGRSMYHGHGWLAADDMAEKLDVKVEAMADECLELHRQGLVDCKVSLGSGALQSVGLSDGLRSHIYARARKLEEEREARHRVVVERDRAEKPPSNGIKRQARELFEYTCELCGCQGQQGRDPR